MIDQDLQIVEIALAVVAPRATKDLVHVGVIALLLRHRATVSDAGYLVTANGMRSHKKENIYQ